VTLGSRSTNVLSERSGEEEFSSSEGSGGATAAPSHDVPGDPAVSRHVFRHRKEETLKILGEVVKAVSATESMAGLEAVVRNGSFFGSTEKPKRPQGGRPAEEEFSSPEGSGVKNC
jgi:hypothetical protein